MGLSLFLLDDYMCCGVVNSDGMLVVAENEENACKIAKESYPKWSEGNGQAHIFSQNGGGVVHCLGVAPVKYPRGLILQGNIYSKFWLHLYAQS